MSNLLEKFEQAAEDVKSLSKRPNNETLLRLYALYKQGKDGDVTGKRPGLTDFAGRAKYDAWKQHQGMDQEEARQKYIELVESLT